MIHVEHNQTTHISLGVSKSNELNVSSNNNTEKREEPKYFDWNERIFDTTKEIRKVNKIQIYRYMVNKTGRRRRPKQGKTNTMCLCGVNTIGYKSGHK